MVSKKDLTQVGMNIEKKIDSEIQALRSEYTEDMERIESNVMNLSVGVSSLRLNMETNMKHIEERFQNMEQRIQSPPNKDSLSNDGRSDGDQNCLAYFANVAKDMEETTAISWLKEQLEKLNTHPEDVFHKGDDYQGRLFARFPTVMARDLAMRKVRQAKISHNGEILRCKPDLPIDKRFVYSVLFGMKYLLCTEWRKYAGKDVDVNLDTQQVTIKKADVISITFENGEPKVQYAQDWEKWLDGWQWGEIMDGAYKRYKKAQEMANM